MKHLTLAVLATVGFFAMMAMAEATVLRVVVVETTDMTGYMDDLAKVRAALKRLGSPTTVRMWRARFAGPNAGAIVVAVEYPDMAAFAADDVKTRGDAEYVSLMKGMDSKRKIVSDSLYEEIK